MQQKLWLKETKTEIFNETLANFTQREEGFYCIHSKGFKEIRKSINCSNYEQEKDLSDSEDNEADEVIVDQLCAEPLLAAVFLDGEYAMISKATRQLNPQNVLECLSCHSNKHKCKHISGYIDWAVDNSLAIQDLRITEETKTTSPREEF